MNAGPLAQDEAVTRPGTKRSSSLLVTVLALAGIAGLTALGVWQLERRAWKLELIARVEHRVHAAPGPIPSPASWPAVTAAADEYRHVAVSGRFLNDHETLVRAVTDDGPGFWVMTPLVTADGATVLVNRGFVPPERREPASRIEANPTGTVNVTGLLRMSEPKGGFLRHNDPQAKQWYSRDVAAIASAQGLPAVAPFFVDADAAANPGGYPVGGLTVVRFPNNHLIYALTWFSLAFMLAAKLLAATRGGLVRSTGRSIGLVRRLGGGARASAHRTGSDASHVAESAR